MEPGLSEVRHRVVSIVLVTWNSARYLPRCLEGIAQQSWPALELIVVDNASDDDSLALATAPRQVARCDVIRNATNDGFSRAVNQALTVARGEFVLLLNPDARLEPQYIERLVAAFDTAGDEFGAATGTLMRGEGFDIAPTDVVDSMGIRMTRSGRHFDVGQGRRVGEDTRGVRAMEMADGRSQLAGNDADSPAICDLPSAIHEVFGVSGAAAMYRRSFIDDVTIDGQFLDEDFFAFREDADVAWRGRLLGWRALYVPDARATHVRTVMPDRRRDLAPAINMHSVKNRFLLRLKNEGAYLALRNAPFEITRDLVTIAAVLTIERSSLPALAWLWRNRVRVMAHRREIQRRRRVSDRALAGWFR